MEWWMYLSIVTSVAATAGLITLIFKIGKWVGVYESPQKTFDKFIEKVEQQISEMRNEFREDIKELRDQIFSTKKTVPGSPIQLTDFGREMSKTLDTDNWAEGVAREIPPNVRKMEPHEVQEYAYKSVDTFLGKD